jgi:hypothetical protein
MPAKLMVTLLTFPIRNIRTCLPVCYNNTADMNAFKVELEATIDGYRRDCMINFNDNIAAVIKFECNKGDGNTGLSSDHVKSSCPKSVSYSKLHCQLTSEAYCL